MIFFSVKLCTFLSADKMIIPRTDDIIVIRAEKNIGFHLCITVYQHRAVLLVLIQNRVFYTLDFSVIPSHQQCVNAHLRIVRNIVHMHRLPVKFVLRQFLLLAFFPAFRHFTIHSFPVQNASDVIISFQMLHANCPASQIDGIKIPETSLFPFRLRSRFAVLLQNIFPDQRFFLLQIFPAMLFCFVFMTITDSFIRRLKDWKKLGTFAKWCLLKSENILLSLFSEQTYTARSAHSRRGILLCKHNSFPEVFC